MQSIIRSWGNSQGLYIPKKLLKEASLSVNDPVDISVVAGVLTIRRSNNDDRKRNALQALREIRQAHSSSTASISNDYRTERDQHIDEKYSK